MRARLPALVLDLGLTSACEGWNIVELDAADGVYPFWYAESLWGLPARYTPDAWPDGVYKLHLASGQATTMAVATRADGGRDVTFAHDALLLDAPTSTLFRDALGANDIGAIVAVELSMIELELQTVDLARVGGPPDLLLDGAALPRHGEGQLRLEHDQLVALRDTLQAGEAVWFPYAVRFHLPADGLDALPRDLWLYVVMQPTLYVNVLDTL